MLTPPTLPRRRFTITLETQAGRPIPVPVDLPGLPSAFPDILPAVHTIADVLQSEARQAAAALGRNIRCRCGCNACCGHLVVLGEAEASALLRTLRALPEAQRKRATARFQAGLTRLESAGLLPRLFTVFTREAYNWPSLVEMQDAYWELAIPCPFLEDGACGIYAERPLICRQHAMTSPPEACATPFGRQTSLEKVHPAIDLAGAAAAFDGQWAHNSRVLPMLLCLLCEAQSGKRIFPVLEPEPMLERFMEFAVEHHSRKG